MSNHINNYSGKTNKNNSIYAPNIRGFMDSDPKQVHSCSKDGKSCVKLPNHVTDPIICNNIATWEFDYTYNDDSLFHEDFHK